MTTILHIGQFNKLRLKRCFLNQIAPKISNGLIRNGYQVLNYDDRDMARLFGLGVSKKWGIWRMNRHLINYCQKVLPDAIILGHADTVYSETLAELRERFPQLRILQYNVDWIDPSYEVGNVQRIQSKLDVVDITLVTTGDKKLLRQFKRAGNIVGFLPNPTDYSIETANMYEVKEPTADLMYCAGNGTRQFGEEELSAQEVVQRIQKKLPNIKLFAAGMTPECTFAGAVYQNAFKQAGMGLNLSRRNDIFLYSSDRMAHIMGNGQLCLMDRRSGYDQLFDDNEIGFYSSPEELYSLIEKFKKTPSLRQKIARNGTQKYRSLFNEQVVARYMTDLLFQEFKAEKYAFPTVVA